MRSCRANASANTRIAWSTILCISRRMCIHYAYIMYAHSTDGAWAKIQQETTWRSFATRWIFCTLFSHSSTWSFALLAGGRPKRAQQRAPRGRAATSGSRVPRPFVLCSALSSRPRGTVRARAPRRAMADDEIEYEEVDMDLVEQIVMMVDEDGFKQWECATPSKADTPEEDSLAQAQRFMAAQSFLLSWQHGKVPTGWRRPRRFADFADESPLVLGAAKAVAQQRMEDRNAEATSRINERRSLAMAPAADAAPSRLLTRKEVASLKDAYSKFSSDLYDINTALGNAAAAIAETILRTDALEESGVA